MKTLSLLISLVILSQYACITIEHLPTRLVNDGSDSIREIEKQYIHPFNEADMNSINSPNQFQLLSGTDLRQVVSKKNYVIVVIWASWCPICHLYLRKMKSWKDSLAQMNQIVELMLAEQNFNITYSQQVLAEVQYNYLSYIIDPLAHGKNESYKTDNLIYAIDKTRKKHGNGAVPKTIVFDHDGKVVFEGAGKRTTLHNILEAIK